MRVKIATGLQKITSGHTRYATGCVKVLPKADGGVFVAATDGYCVVVVVCEGESEGAVHVPGSLMPVGDLPVVIEGDEELRTDKGRVGKPGEGKFFDIPSILPTIESDCRVVGVDLSILERVAAALGTKQLLLLVPESDPKCGYVTSPIPILSENRDGFALLGRKRKPDKPEGFGLVMPLRNEWSAVECYNQLCEPYVKSEKAIK